MLLLLISIIGLLIINFGIGSIVKNILKIDCQSFALTSFFGILSIAFFQTIIAFFSPLNIFNESVFLIFGLIGILVFLKKKDFSYPDIRKNFNVWFYFFVATIVFVGSFSPFFYDHYSYYSPTISMLREAGLVKGVSNLDLLLGQSSFWHIYQSGFSNILDGFLRINSYLLILFLMYIYERRQWILLVFIPFFLIFIQQPSPDLPTFIIALIVLNELLNNTDRKLLLYLSIFAFCIKPIMFWLPLLVVLESIKKRSFKFQMLLPIFTFGILFLIKNLWLFGFPVFPVSTIDFDLPWKPSQEILTYSSQIGFMKSYDMHYSYQQILDFNLLEKIYHWFTIGFKSVFNIGIILSILILGFLALKKKDRFYVILFICILFKLVLIIIFSAQYRFFIDVYLITLFLIFKNISEEKVIFTSVVLSILISIIFIFPGFVKDKFHMGKWMSGFQMSQLIRPTEFESEIPRRYQLGNLKFNATKGLVDKTSFPAMSLYWLRTYQYYGVFPQISDHGFIQKKLTGKEKIKLQEIIDDLERPKPKIP
ncbi:hypothetical protein J2X97_002305 [Epilithonimonas hungarica]|uniref:LIC_10190 family membrane protein n=1 Tax=Epilithonimonas hungarica TaxID=454006 RepID=UPI002786B86F|nr:hypothetical protein [Epilithonimonas hungarica]MDP9956646.1 hypothetical protein [Epilithonimonas hungarica]